MEYEWGRSSQETCNISETGQDRTKIAIDDQYEVAFALSIGANLNQKTLDDLLTLKGLYALCFKTHASFRATTISMKIDYTTTTKM